MRATAGLSATRHPISILARGLVFFVAMVCASFVTVAHADLYRWTTEDGMVHYGDNMPSSQAIHGYDLINPTTGEVIRHIDRAKTPQEIAADEAAKAAAERARDKAKAEQEAQSRRDRMLLDLYSNTADLERARKRRLGEIDRMIEQTQNAIERANDQLKNAHSSAEQKSASDDILQLRRNLFDLQEHRRVATKELDDDLRRFEQLKAKSERSGPSGR